MPTAQKTIYLARHAKSSWDSSAVRDYDRPLSERGLRDAQKMAEKLVELSWRPEKIIASPALRAKQTCEAYCLSFGIQEGDVLWDKNIYAAYMVTLLHTLTSLPEDVQSVMLLGHNPSMEDLLVHLCGDAPRQKNGKLMTTGNVARLSISIPWNELIMHHAELQTLLRPKEL